MTNMDCVIAKKPKEHLWKMTVVILFLVTRCDASTSGSSRSKCTTAMETVLKAANSGIDWAIEMVDASGKPQPGIKSLGFFTFGLPEKVPFGSLQFLGNYDQCLRIKTTQDFGTLYCRTHLQIEKVGPVNVSRPRNLFVDLCVPDHCSGRDLMPFVKQYIQQLPALDATVKDSMCLEKNRPLTHGAKAAICVLAILLTLVVLGTAYDVVVIQDMFSVFDRGVKNEVKSTDINNDGLNDLDNDKVNEGKEIMKNSTGNPGNFGQVLLSFSVHKNASNLLARNQSKGGIPCINGIRVFFVIWVILGHVHAFGGPTMENVVTHNMDATRRLSHMPLTLYFLVVDTFFVLSGLLLTYNTMRELHSTKPTLNYFKRFYLHRFWRLTPTYFLVVMVYILLFKYSSEGPFWPQEITECKNSWWKNLLYINNFEKYQNMCMMWTWSMSMEMQFLLVSPLILMPLYFFDVMGLLVPLLMLVSSAFISGVLSYVFKLTPTTELMVGFDDYMTYNYLNPISRFGPYLVGMITGYVLYKTDCKAKLSKAIIAIGWTASIVVPLSIYFAIRRHSFESRMSNEMSSLLNALQRILWGMAMSWLVFACACGYGGFVNRILSWKALMPFAGISYCTYLVHPIVLKYYFLSQRRMFYLNDINFDFAFMGNVTVSFIAALILYLLFEAPFTNLEKTIRRLMEETKTKFHQS